ILEVLPRQLAYLPAEIAHGLSLLSRHADLFAPWHHAAGVNRANKPSPVFQISPAPNVMTRSPALRYGNTWSTNMSFCSTKVTAGWPAERTMSANLAPDTPGIGCSPAA